MPEIDFAADPVVDLEERLVALRERCGRIAPIKWKGETAWVVLRYQDVAKCVGDDQYIPAAPEYLRNWDTQGAQPLKLEGAAHKASRGVLEVPFRPGPVKKLIDSLLVPLADRLIDEFGDRREVDLVEDYSRRYTFLVMSTILGVPVNEEKKLIGLVYALLQGGHIVGSDAFEVRRRVTLEAVAQMNAYLRPTIEARRREPKDDMISYLLAATENGKPLSEETLYDYVRFLYPAGAETTHLSIGRLMNNVLSDLTLRDRLVANPSERATAMEESLRFTPAACLVPRTLAKDTVICDLSITAGSTVLLAVASGNRDADVFANPEQFSIDVKRKPVLSFGMGVHYCLGVHLAKAELLTSLNRLLERLPGLRLAQTPPPPMGAVFRWLPELRVTFDKILPAKS